MRKFTTNKRNLVAGVGKLQIILTKSCKLSTEQIMRTKTFNFVYKFVQNGRLSTTNSVLLEKKFEQKNFSDGLKFIGQH